MQENSGVGQLYWLVAAAGIALAYMWYRLVRSYKNLNSAKFDVIHEIARGELSCPKREACALESGMAG